MPFVETEREAVTHIPATTADSREAFLQSGRARPRSPHRCRRGVLHRPRANLPRARCGRRPDFAEIFVEILP